jgi:16S rRNA (cytosine967-C5)-methyltransferase
MTPAARIQATIEVLDAIAGDARPADLVTRRYLRKRRYIGSKDRRAITARVYAVLRAGSNLDWQISHHGGDARARARVLLHVALEAGSETVAALCDGSTYAPPALHAAEAAMIAAAQADDGTAMPRAVRIGYPAWLEPALAARFGDALESEAAALLGEAALDVRVNELAASRDEMLATLASLGLEAAPTPLSPIGIRLGGRPNITGIEAYRDGLIEIQDEGAQLVSLLAGGGGEDDGDGDGAVVIDFCAGAGGKTLAIAAKLSATARLIACDTDAGRLKRMEPRLARAGIKGVETRVLAPDDGWLGEQNGIADRVLVDMPCSGTGTWRRAPDQPARLTPERLGNFQNQQAAILGQAAKLVKPGGRLIYSTCSVLRSENEDQIALFLNRNDYRALDIADVWAETIGGEAPAAGASLQLSPGRHGTDGFFVAVLEKKDK